MDFNLILLQSFLGLRSQFSRYPLALIRTWSSDNRHKNIVLSQLVIEVMEMVNRNGVLQKNLVSFLGTSSSAYACIHMGTEIQNIFLMSILKPYSHV